MQNSTPTSTFSMGPLARTDFTSEQDRANVFAQALLNQQIAVPAPSQAGNVKLTLNQQSFPVPSGATTLDTALDLTQAIVELVTTNLTATIGLLAASTASGSNGRGVVNFTAAAPDASYTLIVTTLTGSVIQTGTLVPPTTDPHIVGGIWNNNGVLTISAG